MAVLCIALIVIAIGCNEGATTTSVEGRGSGITDAGQEPEPGAWEELNTTGDTPAARAYHAMAYDSETKKVLVFGGTDGDSGLDDTWAYHPRTDTWADLQPAGDDVRDSVLPQPRRDVPPRA